MTDEQQSSDGPITIKGDGLHSDADFMAAIDQQMDALKKPKEEKAPDKQEDSGEKITVKTNSPKTTPLAASSPDSQSATIAVRREGKKEAPKPLSHKGRTIKPLSESIAPAESDEKVEVKVHPEQPTQEPETAAQSPEPAKENPELGTQNPAEEKELNTVTTKPEEPKTEPAKVATKAEDKPQALKTFDTTKYHLPIKPTRHHRQRSVHPAVAVILFLLLAVFITAAAIDMGIIDIGIKLPFDFL